jgi:hypothetical protein
MVDHLMVSLWCMSFVLLSVIISPPVHHFCCSEVLSLPGALIVRGFQAGYLPSWCLILLYFCYFVRPTRSELTYTLYV